MPIDLTVALVTDRQRGNPYQVSEIEFKCTVYSSGGPYFPVAKVTDYLLIFQFTSAFRKPSSSHLFLW
jgi:hypothetical protein